MVEHLPDPPSWACTACDRPWPCQPAREHLAATMGRTELFVYAAGQFDAALRDMGTTPVSELYDRFFAWVGR